MQIIEQDTAKLQRFVNSAIDYLFPYFELKPEQIWYPEAAGTLIHKDAPRGLKTATYGDGKITLAWDTDEGDHVIGHECGHHLHGIINPRVLQPYTFCSPWHLLMEGVANYAGYIYSRRRIPNDKSLKFNLKELLNMSEDDMKKKYWELTRFNVHLNIMLQTGK